MNARLAAAVATGLFASACAAAIMAGADFAPGTDFTQYSSFTWDEPDESPVGDPRLENNPFFEDRVETAIERELFDHGIEYRETGADLVAHYHATVRDRVEVYEADEAAGYAGTDYGGGTQVLQYEEGTFLVDLADAESQEILWRGWSQMDFSRALTNALVMEDQIREAVGRMFRSWPASNR